MRKAEIVRDFFNKMAPRYRRFYTARKQTLHKQRLHLACQGLDFRELRILDLGAGTGALYDHIVAKGGCREYLAIDISAGMLRESGIPEGSYIIGPIEIALTQQQEFDIVFALGLTSYLSREEMETLVKIVKKKAGQQAIISFTSHLNPINMLRFLLRPLLTKFSHFSIGARFPLFLTSSSNELKRWPNVQLVCFFGSYLPSSCRMRMLPLFDFLYSDFLIKIDSKPSMT